MSLVGIDQSALLRAIRWAEDVSEEEEKFQIENDEPSGRWGAEDEAAFAEIRRALAGGPVR